MYDVRIAVNKFKSQVAEYEEQPIKEGLIMFYGDSGFTRWSEAHGNTNLTDDIRKKDGSIAAVCHGLGGSNADQLLYWYPRMVRPWKPRALVLKVYNNDRDRNYSPEEIVFLQSRIFEWARTDMPGIKMFVCDAQPILKDKDRIDTWYYHQKEYNELISAYCEKHDDVTMVWQSRNPELYVNSQDVGDYTKIREDIFIEDQVHFNKTGYEICKRFWLEQLKDLL